MNLHGILNVRAHILNVFNDATQGVDKLKTASALWLLCNLSKVPSDIRGAIHHSAGGHVNHGLFWRAIVTEPAVVLADEPTGNLDPHTAAQVLQLLRQSIKREGAAGILVTHSPEAAASADRVLILKAEGLFERST